MGKETKNRATRIDHSVATDMMLATQRLCEIPLSLYTFWWYAGVEAFWPHMPRFHHAAHHDEHAQLVVPDPVEVAAEHALFA